MVNNRNICKAVLVVFLILLLLVLESKNEYLLVAVNDAEKNNGPVTVIDLQTKKVTQPSIAGIGCSGVHPIDTNSLEISCFEGEEGVTRWLLDTKRLTAEPVEMSGGDMKRFEGSPRPRIVGGNDGWRFYNGGGPSLFSGNGFTTAKVVAERGDEQIEIPISDTAEAYFISRMVYDPAANVLWVMSISEGAPTLIDRLDIGSFTITASVKIDTYAGFELVLDEDRVLISHFRNDKGDITVLDTKTATVRDTIRLPVTMDESLNALGLLGGEGTVLVGGTGGFWRLSGTAYAQREFIANTDIGQATFLLSQDDDLYVISSYNSVLRLQKSDLSKAEIIYDGTGKGLTQVSYFVNTVRWYRELHSHILSR